MLAEFSKSQCSLSSMPAAAETEGALKNHTWSRRPTKKMSGDAGPYQKADFFGGPEERMKFVSQVQEAKDGYSSAEGLTAGI